MDKKSIRLQMMNLRDSLDTETRSCFSSIILDRLLHNPLYVKASEVFTYVTTGSEVDTYPLILSALWSDKKVFVPKVTGNGLMEFYEIQSFGDLTPGKYKILEPPTTTIGRFGAMKDQIMIVPGVAFDSKKNRIGYGKGFYDRYLHRSLEFNPPTVGICFDCQLAEELPVESLDEKLSMIITEKRIVK